MKTTSVFAVLTAILLAVPAADAGNCHVGFNRSYVVQQQAYVAPVYGHQQVYQNYSTVVPYAVPTVVLPDQFYRVDSALAYAKIAEAAAEAAVNRQNQNLLQLFQDFLRQQAQLQQGQKIPPANQPPDPPQKGELPAVPQPPGKNSNQTPAMAVNEFFTNNCVRCHKPNTKRMDLTGDSAKLTKAHLDEIYHRITAPDDDKDVMPPVEKGKTRPTRIEDINAIHALRKTAK